MQVNSSFDQAAAGGDVDAMRELLAQGADVNCYGGNPLKDAALHDRTAVVRWLLANGADVNPRFGHNVSPLHWAANNANSEIMGLLLAAGADVHHGNDSRTTPLHFLSIRPKVSSPGNRKRCAELLLSYGARVDAEDIWSITPLRYAISHGRHNLIKIFLRAGAREIAKADLPARDERNALTLDLIATIRAGGGWPKYAAKHQSVLASFVSKLSAKSVVPLDAASHLVAFWCPPGGY